MNDSGLKTKNQYLTERILAIAGWITLILQLYLIIINRTQSVTETIIRFFSFYTILTNLLVAIMFTTRTWGKPGRWFSFFNKPSNTTAITVYILIVGLVYNVILRQAWSPVGLQKWVDESLHTFIPLMTLIYWFIYVSHHRIAWTNIFPWMIYPLLYFAYILIRGSYSGFYPYPFIDVTALGYQKVFINSGFVVLTFLMIAGVLIGITTLKNSRKVN